MKKIMIVEDEPQIMEKLVAEAKKVNPKIIIMLADSEEKAFELSKKHEIDAFFLDIELLDSNGIDLAKSLRTINKYQFVPMVFITAVPTKELEAFRQIHCYDYILKPFTDEKIEDIFRKILGDYFSQSEAEDEKLTLEFKGYSQLVKMKDILYVEYKSRKLKIATKTDVISYKHMPLKTFMEKLPYYFIKTHQSFIVNSNYIRKVSIVDSIILLENSDIEIPLGRSYKQKVGEFIND